MRPSAVEGSGVDPAAGVFFIVCEAVGVTVEDVVEGVVAGGGGEGAFVTVVDADFFSF